MTPPTFLLSRDMMQKILFNSIIFIPVYMKILILSDKLVNINCGA